MSTLQKMLDASRRGTAHGMQRAGQLQQLFAQKQQMERQKAQDKWEKDKAQVDMFSNWLGSDNEYIRKQGAARLTEFSKQNPKFFNGPVDFLGINANNKGEENYENLIKQLNTLKKQKESGDLTDEAYASALGDLGTDIAMLDPQYAKRIEGMREARLATVNNKIKMAMEQQKQLAVEKQKQVGRVELEKLKQGAPSTTKPTALAQKIQLMQEKFGVDEQTATGIATGILATSTNPVSGETVLINKATGTSTPIKPKGEPSAQTPPTQKSEEEPPTLWELSDLSTGAMSGLRAGVSKITGQVGLPIAKKTIYARQRVDSAKQKLVRALANNPRYPIGEMKIIRKEINIDDSILDSPRGLRTRMRAIDDYLRSEIETNQEIASDAKMPTDDRQGALKAIKAMESFLEEMGVPEEEAAGGLSKEDQDLLDKYKE